MVGTIPFPKDTTELTVIEDRCEFSGGHQCTIIIEGVSMEALQSAKARSLAIAYAGSKYGMAKAGISGQGGVYPSDAVREDGSVDENSIMVPRQAPFPQRIDYTLTIAL